MARSSLTASGISVARQLADRALVVAASVRASDWQRAPGRVPAALALRLATTVVGRLETVPVRAATPAQRLLLGAATAQLRAAAGSIIVTADRRGHDSEESSLGDLVARTLALANRALACPLELESPGLEPAPLAAWGTERAAHLGDGEREV